MFLNREPSGLNILAWIKTGVSSFHVLSITAMLLHFLVVVLLPSSYCAGKYHCVFYFPFISMCLSGLFQFFLLAFLYAIKCLFRLYLLHVVGLLSNDGKWITFHDDGSKICKNGKQKHPLLPRLQPSSKTEGIHLVSQPPRVAKDSTATLWTEWRDVYFIIDADQLVILKWSWTSNLWIYGRDV